MSTTELDNFLKPYHDLFESSLNPKAPGKTYGPEEMQYMQLAISAAILQKLEAAEKRVAAQEQNLQKTGAQHLHDELTPAQIEQIVNRFKQLSGQ
ncbi:hypothetical protein ACVWYF_003895 [Hymenobacter sp. UYAg731]